MRRFFLFACLLIAGSVLPGTGPILAQNDIMKVIRGNYERRQQDWFQYNFGIGNGPRQEAPRQLQPKPRKAKIRQSPFEAPRPAQDVAEPEKPVIPPSIFVNVLGDSLADLVADGLKAQLADRPDIAVVPHTKSSSGFVRSDFYDWTKAVTDLLASGEKIDAVVWMIGANDRQQLREGDQVFELRSDEWRAAYVRRIDGILAQLKARGIKVIWVGLPPMKNDRLTADVVWFNEIYRERVEASGGVYVDLWDGFVDVDGNYAATGPDINGQVAKLRTVDGVHFSKAGSLLAAHYPEREIRRAFGDAPIAAAPTLTSPLAPGDAGASISTVVPGDADQPEAEKPEYGPILPLETVATSPGGVLLGGGQPVAPSTMASTGPVSPPLGAPADPTAAKVLVRGEPMAPKEGRADDFRWPRPTAATPVKTSSRPLEPAQPSEMR